MAPVAIDVPNLRVGYHTILDTVFAYGDEVAPRGRKTYELLNPTITLEDPSDSLPIGVGRNLSLRVAAVEAVQLCGGVADPKLVLAASENFRQFMEDDGYFHGAYGKRIGAQLYAAVAKLSEDPDSRQAVITLWDPNLDNSPGYRDYPCTVGFQLYVRDGALCMTSIMRSNDVWLGLAYDLFQFSQLQWTAANMLDLPAGPLTHRVTSLHLYHDDAPKIEDISRFPIVESYNLRGFRAPGRAAGIARGACPAAPTPTEEWFHQIIQPLLLEGNE